uniref:Uncharacterized protein n=1 Tax=mine drainage metagenome TaxID=410659 RepID=E6PXD3_9ZZZZ
MDAFFRETWHRFRNRDGIVSWTAHCRRKYDNHFIFIPLQILDCLCGVQKEAAIVTRAFYDTTLIFTHWLPERRLGAISPKRLDCRLPQTT